MPLTRRAALQAGALLAGRIAPARAGPFATDHVVRAARELVSKPYRAPAETLPPELDGLSYDAYRGIGFRQERALWRDRPFQVAFFARGFLYRRGIKVFEVADGTSIPVAYSPDLFDTGGRASLPEGLGFAGLRVHAAINRPGEFDEFCVFLGASYFRAVGRGQFYGLSARGLAIGTGGKEPEEFPFFRTFWLERPEPGASSLVIHALLDSPSAAGAFRFVLRPGETTRIDVESVLLPRVAIADYGVAPLTSMYVFGPRDPASAKRNDWRTAVHDSDGLATLGGGGEAAWRPLADPSALQQSAFPDANPRGFGLLQRQRDFQDYGDLQVLYQRRPSAWVEPVGGWGVGAVRLVEIPTDTEYNDNIVAFWRGRDPLQAGSEYHFVYRLHWGEDAPRDPKLARVERMRIGGDKGRRLNFVLDVAGESVRPLGEDAKTRLELSSTAGRLAEGYSGPNPFAGGWRVSLNFEPDGASVADLRCVLLGEHGPLAETWLHRWTA